MRVPSFFGYEHLQSALLASKGAPYLYAPVPHAASASTMRQLWALEHRYGLNPAAPPSDDRTLRYWRKTAELPWIGIKNGNEDLPHFVKRCEDGLRFSFVRNPYRRLLSAYRTHIVADTVVGRDFRHAARRLPTEEMDFEQFIATLGTLPEHRRHPVFAAQSDWLLTDYIPFHMIGAVERYAADYTAITARLAAPGGRVEELGRPEDRLSCTDAVQGAILDLYGRDFAAFGYDTSVSAATEPPHLPLERRVERSLYYTPFWVLVDSRVQLQLGNNATAIRQIESVIAEGEDGAVPRMLPALRLDLARIHLAAGDLDAAGEVLYTPHADGLVTVEAAAMLGDIAMRRLDPEAAQAVLCQGLDCGLPDAPYLRELGSLSVMLGDQEAALKASRTITALAPPGGVRARLLDALISGLDRPGSPGFAMAVLDALATVDGLGYDAVGKAEELGRLKGAAWRTLAVQAPADPGWPPEPVVATTELRRLAEETTAQIECLRQTLVRTVLQTYPFLFDAEHYRQSWPEAARSELPALEHYIRHGSRDMAREPNPFFNHACYTYHMLRKPLGHLDPLVHYAIKGAPDGIDPGPDFETKRYLRQWPILQGSDANPLNDYLAHGPSESGYYGFMPETVYSELKALTLYDSTLFPHRHLIYCGSAGRSEPERMRRLGAAYSKLDHDLADSFTHLILLPWVAHPGGAERVSAYVLRLLAEQIGPDKVVAIGTDRPSQAGFAMPQGIRLVSLPDYDDALTPDEMVAILERLILERKPGVTFVQNSHAGWLLLAKRARYLHLETSFYVFLFGYHFSDTWGVNGFHTHLSTCLPYLTGIITDNTRFPRVLPTITPMLSEHADKIFIIYTPTAPDLLFQAPVPAKKLRQGLWMSRFSPEKRMDVLGRIAEATPDRRYMVYGSQIPFASPVDISFLEDLPNIALRGYFRDLNDIPFGDCDAFVYTSDFDGLPLVLLEATAMGLPVVAPDVGGIGDFITAETGWLVSGPDAVDEYVAALREIEARPDLVQKKVMAAQKLLTSRHSWEAFCSQYQNIPGMLPPVPQAPLPAEPALHRIPLVPDVDFHVISLGSACQVAYQIRRWLKVNEPIPLEWMGSEGGNTSKSFIPYPFDWLFTPVPGVIRAINSDFKDFLLKENLEYIPDVEPYIQDRLYGTNYFHFFPRTENFMEAYNEVLRKFNRSRENWHNGLSSGKPVMFVRQCTLPPSHAQDVAMALRNAYPDLDFVLLWASPEEDEWTEGNVIYRCLRAEVGNWKGRDDLWDAALDDARQLVC